MVGRIWKHRSLIIMLILAILGFICIAAATTFHFVWAKISLDHLLAEVGALLLVVGMLHWLFEFNLRKEMLREVSAAVVGNTLLHDGGLESCKINSRDVDDRVHWLNASDLTVGVQYSPKFFKDFHDVIRRRCQEGRSTTALVLRPNLAATRYLQDTKTGTPKVEECVAEIRQLLEEADVGSEKHTKLLYHERVLRYSFIRTDEFIWVKFFTNSPERALVPAFKIRSGTPLFEFFDGDIKRLIGKSDE